jgi:uncharacterized membrane protein
LSSTRKRWRRGAERNTKLHVYTRNLYVRINSYRVFVYGQVGVGVDEGCVHVEAGADITVSTRLDTYKYEDKGSEGY